MREGTLEASVQYNDLVGTAAADRSDHIFLSDFARMHGVDTSEYFLIGVRLWVGETGNTGFDILAVETKVVGASIEAVRDVADKNNGRLPYVSLDVEAPLVEALKAFKRFEAVVSMQFENVRAYQRV